MSDQSWPPKNPDEEGATPPTGPSEPTPPAAPAQGPSYSPPPASDPGYTPPPSGGYSPSPLDPYGQSPAAGYQTPYPQQPDPYAQPQDPYAQPQDPYAQQPGPYSQPQDPYSPQPGGYDPGQYGQPSGPYPPAGYPTPQPPTTFGAGGGLVDWPKRAFGGLIDYVAPALVISVLVNVLSAAVGSSVGSLISFVLSAGWWVYLGYKSGTTGVTFGRSIAKTKLVSEATGQPVGVSNGIVRQLAHIIDTLICYIGWLFPLWDSKRQTIADKLVKTVVIDNSGDPNASRYDWGIGPR